MPRPVVRGRPAGRLRGRREQHDRGEKGRQDGQRWTSRGRSVDRQGGSPSVSGAEEDRRTGRGRPDASRGTARDHRAGGGPVVAGHRCPHRVRAWGVAAARPAVTAQAGCFPGAGWEGIRASVEPAAAAQTPVLGRKGLLPRRHRGARPPGPGRARARAARGRILEMVPVRGPRALPERHAVRGARARRWLQSMTKLHQSPPGRRMVRLCVPGSQGSAGDTRTQPVPLRSSSINWRL